MAEAKRRMRRRRVLLGTLLLLGGITAAAVIIARPPGGPGPHQPLGSQAVGPPGHAAGTLFAVSYHGTRVHVGPLVRRMLDGRFWTRGGLAFAAADVTKADTFVRLAARGGVGVYAARTKDSNRPCFYIGHPMSLPGFPRNSLDLIGGGCGLYNGALLPERLNKVNATSRKGRKAIAAWLKAHPFPSPARPLLDMTGETALGALVGVAADGVRSVRLLAQSDCHPVVTVPVINNVFIDPHPPQVRTAFLVARDAGGKVVWHSAPFNESKRTPQECGLP